MPAPVRLDLEDLVTAVYCALDDALAHAAIPCESGKLVGRRGPPPTWTTAKSSVWLCCRNFWISSPTTTTKLGCTPIR